ncbi:MAG TPA: hypothetical protein VL737_02030 [Candidatus Pristimantibacillus sp.]|jgi:hypothetical protein|nr:hypothetical protein [Candidatus Pristimantibacillus sp.]
MKALQPLVNDPRNYLESVGRVDQVGLYNALQEQGEGTVIRACFWRG